MSRANLQSAVLIIVLNYVNLLPFTGTGPFSGLGTKNWPLFTGLGMIALRSGVPVVPVAIYGSEKAFKKFRPQITITYGEPMILAPKGKKITREDIDEATNKVMHKIAEMLPPEYRGVYSSQG